MNEEYEYSFKVNEIKEFINYCVNNSYELIEKSSQIRTLYKNGGKVMARITKNTCNDKVVEVLNFKDDNLTNTDLNISRESEDLIITDDNRIFVKSLLDILELKENKVLIRDRVIYQKNNVKFEIDKYTSPIMNVVAIEGNKEEVDNVYKELHGIIELAKIDE